MAHVDYYTTRRWLETLLYEDLVYLCVINSVGWFPHHCNKEDLLQKLIINNNCATIINMYGNKGMA